MNKKCIINTKKRHVFFLNCYIKLKFDIYLLSKLYKFSITNYLFKVINNVPTL